MGATAHPERGLEQKPVAWEGRRVKVGGEEEGEARVRRTVRRVLSLTLLQREEPTTLVPAPSLLPCRGRAAEPPWWEGRGDLHLCGGTAGP